MRVNIKLLAERLSLSKGTVSKALRDSHEISPETKKRVVALAEELNYIANPYASSLRRKKSNTIAVVVPDVADSYFSLAIKGVEAVAQSKGYHVLIYLTYESFEKEVMILDDFQNGRVDGVLISVSSATSDAKHIEALADEKIPVVLFDRVIDELDAAKVVTNDFDSGYIATEHLVKNGCTRIDYLSISPHLAINTKRMDGYKKALTDSNIDPANCKVIDCSNDNDENCTTIRQVLNSGARPDGILASVEKLITPVYLLCKELNIRIPADLKIVSFSNLPTADILQPALSTIKQPAFEMGKTAATVLFKALEKPRSDYKKEYMLPSTLHSRESSIDARQ